MIASDSSALVAAQLEEQVETRDAKIDSLKNDVRSATYIARLVVSGQATVSVTGAAVEVLLSTEKAMEVLGDEYIAASPKSGLAEVIDDGAPPAAGPAQADEVGAKMTPPPPRRRAQAAAACPPRHTGQPMLQLPPAPQPEQRIMAAPEPSAAQPVQAPASVPPADAAEENASPAEQPVPPAPRITAHVSNAAAPPALPAGASTAELFNVSADAVELDPGGAIVPATAAQSSDSLLVKAAVVGLVCCASIPFGGILTYVVARDIKRWTLRKLWC